MTRAPSILLGVTVWAAQPAPAKARIITEVLSDLATMQSHPQCVGFDWMIVDNDTQDPQVRTFLHPLGSHHRVSVHRFSPQLGWAGARNFMIQTFMQGHWDRLVMLDQDAKLQDPLWINRVARVAQTDPDLHAYMLLGFPEDLIATAQLPGSGTPVRVCREFLGGCHVISRRVPEVIGGYNTHDFPLPWGWHDVEFGRRLVRSGLLDVCGGHYVDPIGIQARHFETSEPDPTRDAIKQAALQKYMHLFRQRETEITNGIGLYQPFLQESLQSDAPTEAHP